MKKREAIKIAGGSAKLACLLGVSKSAVSQWGDSLPELRALQMERLLKNKKVLPKSKKA